MRHEQTGTNSSCQYGNTLNTRSTPRADVITLQIMVLLATNMGFLAMHSADSVNSHRTVAMIASYASTILCLGSYFIWWILSRQHPPGTLSTASEAVSSRIVVRYHEPVTQQVRYNIWRDESDMHGGLSVMP